MANISSAFGTITIKVEGGRPDIIEDFTYLFGEVLGGGWYYTATNDWEYDGNEATATFDGCGRWTYQTNAEMTYEWIKNGIPRVKDETIRAELQSIWDELNQLDWSINYEFVDEECGNGVLYEQDCYVEHKAGEDEARYNEGNFTSYDYTPENLVELGFQDSIEEAKEYLGWADEDDEGGKDESNT